ncbi:MAG TPA: alpha/beta hydrolase, partial [Polyangia bacterium]|nr:alpha/beta hydrolase [Polyangia bacterium]
LVGRRAKLARAGLALMALTLGLRGCTAARGERLTMTTTDDQGARWAARVVDEADVAVAGARVLVAAGMLHDPDAGQVPDALRRAYDRMRAAEGDAPSPVVPTLLGLESPDRADVIVVDGVAQPKGAVIFLHGFAGGFALPCWQLARAAREADLVTYCPSVGARGDWWTEHGARTLAKTVALARRRGIDRLYLAGLSNGAVGVAHLAPKMRGTFRGVILISGCAPDQPAPGVPALVVQGRRDAMSGASRARAYAARTGARYVELDAGHFAFLLREDEAHRAIAAWLKSH